MERVFGVRSVPPASNIQRLFNDVGRPQWQTEMRVGSPEAQNIVNEYVFPYLEMMATALFEGGRWDSLDLKTKQKTLNNLLGGEEGARGAVRDMLKSQAPGSDLKKAELIWQVTGLRSLGKDNYEQTLKDFDIDESNLADMNENELEVLVWFIKENAKAGGDLIDNILNDALGR